jgi:DNA-binding SARP family transcriptional activator
VSNLRRTLGDGVLVTRGHGYLLQTELGQVDLDQIARLQEARLAAVEDRIDAELAQGEHAALVSELDALVHEYPSRERLQAQLMLALYRCGRQADALERYRRARRSLTEELGIEPGRELQQLEHAILTHDPALEAPPRGSTRRPTTVAGGRARGDS